MSELTAQDKRDMSQFLGRTWGILLTAGILTFGLGVVMLVWPKQTVLVVSWLLGVYLIIAGVSQIVQSFTGDRSGGVRALLAIGGILSLALGLFAFRSAAHSVAVLVLLIGIAWLMSGIGTLVTAISDHDLPGRGWAIFSGILGILGGLDHPGLAGADPARAHLVLRALDDRGGSVRGLRVVQDALPGQAARRGVSRTARASSFRLTEWPST